MVQKPALKLDDLVIKREKVVSRLVDDKVIILCPESTHPVRLNATGARIWELMDHPSRVEDLMDVVQRLYEVERDEFRADMMAFLSELLERKLIENH